MATKSLHTLIRLARWDVDEKRRALGQLIGHEENLLRLVAELEQELKREQAAAAQDPAGIGYLYGAYHQRYVDRRDGFHRQIAQVRALIAEAQEVLGEAFRQQKAYELAQEARDKREKEEANRKEQETMDEIGLTLYRRREGDVSE